uniref:Uncharacterized protein n=1 Tax=Candidatus Kentrum sp. LPFa TaxID=2126335 RepID=A0A450WM51_9GAMM|nr:MAG: hypothetical protein BECKLPF1236A_GA0070988_101894 [Candidatus Kentron sp. LPFa]VFK32731.1 MAG: hypothetical protein BECKLPF1236C_GA0070990_101794 [Candidatus Kentron sp. LPFa]
MKLSQVVALILFFLSCNVNSDTIKFDTGNPDARIQRFLGEVKDISGEFIDVKFMHNDYERIYRIHISRIHSLYFNNKIQHPNSFSIRSSVNTSIGGNLERLRTLYITENFSVFHTKCYTHGNNLARRTPGNIVKLFRSNGTAQIRCLDKSRTQVDTIDNIRLGEQLRAWVR